MGRLDGGRDGGTDVTAGQTNPRPPAKLHILPHRPDVVIRDSLRSQTGHIPQPLPALGCVERFGAVQTFYRPA